MFDHYKWLSAAVARRGETYTIEVPDPSGNEDMTYDKDVPLGEADARFEQKLQEVYLPEFDAVKKNSGRGTIARLSKLPMHERIKLVERCIPEQKDHLHPLGYGIPSVEPPKYVPPKE